MMGSLSRAGVWFVVVVVGGAMLVGGTLWLLGCSVVDTLWAGSGTLIGCLDLGLDTSWEGRSETRNETF